MPLILAIEPDKRQAAHITSMARHRLHAELVLAVSAERALAALGDRIPDLILTPALLPPQDDAALAERLRELDERAAHVQTLTIPLLAAPGLSSPARGMLAALRRERPGSSADGCDPAVFAEQITAYLERAAIERQEHHRTHDGEPIAVSRHAAVEGDAADPIAAFEPEPAIVPEPAFRSEPAFHPEPAFQSEPVFQAAPAFQAEPALRSEPAFQSEPIFEPEPAQTHSTPASTLVQAAHSYSEESPAVPELDAFAAETPEFEIVGSDDEPEDKTDDDAVDGDRPGAVSRRGPLATRRSSECGGIHHGRRCRG